MRTLWERLRHRPDAEVDRRRSLERRLWRERPRPARQFTARARLALLASAASGGDRRRARLLGWSLIGAGLALLIVALVIAAS